MIKDYGFFHDYPYTNFHEMNLDWLLAQMLELRSDMRDFVNQNTIKYADPIQWNITTQYEGNTVVIEPNSGNAYISSQPVPAGVPITNTDYWSVIGNFSILYESIKESIAAADDGSSINATEARAEGSLLWLNSKLYKVLSDISVGALYITSGTGQNLEEVTIEELINNLKLDMNQINETLTDAIEDEIAARTEADDALEIKIANIIYTTPEEYGAIGDGVADDTEAVQNAMNDSKKYVILRNSYKITESIVIPSDMKIEGIKNNKIIDETSFPTTDNHVGVFNITSKENVNIKGVNFVGSNATGNFKSSYDYGNFIIGISSEKIKITDCSFIGSDKQDCIMLVGCGNSDIRYCKFLYSLYASIGILDECYNITIDHCFGLNPRFKDDAVGNRYFIHIGSDRTPHTINSHVMVTNNMYFTDNPYWEAYDAHGGNDLIFSNNVAYGEANGICVFTSANNYQVSRAIISNNIIYGGTNASPHQGNRIASSGITIGGFYIECTGNIILNGGDYADHTEDGTFKGGIRVVGAGLHGIISNNFIQAYRNGICLDGGIGGNYITSDFKIHNNSVQVLSKSSEPLRFIHFNDSGYFGLVEVKDNYISQGNSVIIHIPTTKVHTSHNIKLTDNNYSVMPTYENIANCKPDFCPTTSIGSITVGVVGDFIRNSAPTASGVYGWVCTAGGLGSQTKVYKAVALSA